jgi:hypothetical protein
MLWVFLVIASVSVVLGYLSGRALYAITEEGAHLARLWWYFLAFISGCTLTLSSTVLPNIHILENSSLHRRVGQAFAHAGLYSLGWVVVYGCLAVFALLIGIFVVRPMTTSAPAFTGWLLLLMGVITYAISLGESGFIRLRRPCYQGSTPERIAASHPLVQPFHLGIYAAVITAGGVPALLVLFFGVIVLKGNIAFGLSLIGIHIAALFLTLASFVFLARYRFRVTTWVTTHRHSLLHGLSFITIIIGAYLLARGLSVLTPAAEGVGLQGQSTRPDYFFFAFLVLLPLWVSALRAKMRLSFSPVVEIARIQDKVDVLEEERRRIEDILGISDSVTGSFASSLHQLDAIEKQRRIYEDAARWRVSGDPRSHAHAEALIRVYRRRTALAFGVTLLLSVIPFL